jgi:transposase
LEIVMGRAAIGIELSAVERRELESLAGAHKTGQAMARRARIVLAAASGMENKAICLEVGAEANTVGKWRRRFAELRLDGLLDEPRPGTPRKIGDDEIADTIRRTLETTPSGATHWSLRSMAKAVGHAPSTIHRIELSNDPLARCTAVPDNSKTMPKPSSTPTVPIQNHSDELNRQTISSPLSNAFVCDQTKSLKLQNRDTSAFCDLPESARIARRVETKS